MTNVASLAAPARRRPTLTARQIARRTGHSTMVIRQVLELMAEEHLVEQEGDGWRLTPETEREFGSVFRGFWGFEEAEAA